jgi:hypothetical protein
MKGPYSGYDVDTERIAETLRDLADDIEDGGVVIMKERDYTDVRPDEAVRFGLGFEFEAMVGSRTLGTLAQHLQERNDARVIR